MSAGEFHLETLRRLAAMPFLDRLELAAVSGVPDRSVYNAVAALEREGLVASLPHATALLRRTRRYFLTNAGLRRLAGVEAITLEQLMRRHRGQRPVAAHPAGTAGRRGRHLPAHLLRLRGSRNRLVPVVPGSAPGRRYRAQ